MRDSRWSGSFTLFTVLLGSVCGDCQTIRIGIDPVANFGSYRSFCQEQLTNPNAGIDAVVQSEIASELIHMGLKQRTAGCDLILIETKRKAEAHQSWSNDTHGGSPTTIAYGPHAPGDVATTTELGWNGWGNGFTSDSSSTSDGIELEIDFIDPSRKKVVFQGQAFVKTSDCNQVSGSKRNKCDAKENNASRAALTKLLKKYPRHS